MWRCGLIERSPLWPARPPPTFTATPPGGRSSSSCTMTSCVGSSIAVAAHERARRPRPRVVHVRQRERERAPACPPMRASSTSARSLPFERLSFAPWRAASSSTTSAPTLWRVPAYSSPGLPSPTTRGRRACPAARPWPSRAGAPARLRSARRWPRRPRASLAFASLDLRPPPRRRPACGDRGHDGVVGIDVRGDAVRASRSLTRMTSPICMSDDVDGELVRDVAGLAVTRSLLRAWSTRPPFVQHGLGLALEDDRHLDRRSRVEVDPEEVDVDDVAPHRVALHLLDDGGMRWPVDLEVDEGVQPAGLVSAWRSSGERR